MYLAKGEEEFSHHKVRLHQVGWGFTCGEVAIGSSTTVVDSVYDDPLLCRRKEIFECL
jgi:hypothetical protein